MRPSRLKILCPVVLMCCFFNVMAFAGVQGQMAAFRIDDHTIGAFVVSDAGSLYRVQFDTNSKTAIWKPQGGWGLRPSVAAASPKLAFVIGGDRNLYARWGIDDNGDGGNWANQGNPGVTLSGNMSVIGFIDQGVQKYYVFVVGDDGSLYTNWWNGWSWQWAGLGGTQLTHYPSTITYVDNNGNRQIKIYVVGGDGNLYVEYRVGLAWQWQYLGNPSETLGCPFNHCDQQVAYPSAGYKWFCCEGVSHWGEIVYVVGTGCHFFGCTSGNELYSWEIDGWTAQGGSQLANSPPATVPDTSEWAFIVGGDNSLYWVFADGAWTPEGGSQLSPFISVAPGTWNQPPAAFVIGGNRRLYTTVDNPSGFQDLSAFPVAP